jgi:hypothetical protein
MSAQARGKCAGASGIYPRPYPSDGVVIPRLLRPPARRVTGEPRSAPGAGGRPNAPGGGARPDHRASLEGLPRGGRDCAGAGTRSRGADPRRADRRPRPREILETRRLIKDLGRDHTVVLSTHVLPEVSMTCTRVVIINRGRIVAEDSSEGLAARGRLPLTVALFHTGWVRQQSKPRQTGVTAKLWCRSGRAPHERANRDLTKVAPSAPPVDAKEIRSHPANRPFALRWRHNVV